MSEEPKAKRRGRPALPPSEKKRRNVTFRLRDSFREEIERRAVANGRSMSEEIETILERFVPISDVITKKFVEDVRGVLEQSEANSQNRYIAGEIARWNARILRKFANDVKYQSEALKERMELYSKIENIMLNVEVNETDRQAILNGLGQDLSNTVKMIQDLYDLPDMPNSLKELAD